MNTAIPINVSYSDDIDERKVERQQLRMRNGADCNIICGNTCITICHTEVVITWSLPGKFPHLYEFSISSFHCMVCRSFHTLSQYDFRSNVIRLIKYI